jgi:hypothetical protein
MKEWFKRITGIAKIQKEKAQLEAERLAAEEAAKWALEQVENKRKDSDLDGERGRTSDKESQGRLEGYVQNAEQNESTIWQRVKNFKKGL